MRRFSPLVGILIAVMGARTARAETEDPGAAAQGAHDEAADRDVAAAIPMYRKVMALAPASDAARDAGLRLLELLEQRGEKTAALEVAVALTERLSARLDDDAKRKVHEAMARMLPAGSKARSPLGEIYVVPPANAPSAASPHEAKVFALQPRVDARETEVCCATWPDRRGRRRPAREDPADGPSRRAVRRARADRHPGRSTYSWPRRRTATVRAAASRAARVRLRDASPAVMKAAPLLDDPARRTKPGSAASHAAADEVERGGPRRPRWSFGRSP
jgi:hypothetical protein